MVKTASWDALGAALERRDPVFAEKLRLRMLAVVRDYEAACGDLSSLFARNLTSTGTKTRSCPPTTRKASSR